MYNCKNYTAHGGNETVIGGKLTFLAGAEVEGLADILGSTAPTAATESTFGGVKAADKGNGDTVEAKIGDDGKLYVPTYPASYTLPTAAADALGGVNAAANQADSTASTVATLKDDFNGLLAKLKAAGIMIADTPGE